MYCKVQKYSGRRQSTTASYYHESVVQGTVLCLNEEGAVPRNSVSVWTGLPPDMACW